MSIARIWSIDDLYDPRCPFHGFEMTIVLNWEKLFYYFVDFAVMSNEYIPVIWWFSTDGCFASFSIYW